MKTKAASALIAILAFQGLAEAQPAGTIDLRGRQVHVIVDGELQAIDQRHIRRNGSVVVITVPTDRDQATTQADTSRRGQGAPTLLDRNRSSSPD